MPAGPRRTESFSTPRSPDAVTQGRSPSRTQVAWRRNCSGVSGVQATSTFGDGPPTLGQSSQRVPFVPSLSPGAPKFSPTRLMGASPMSIRLKVQASTDGSCTKAREVWFW